MTSVRLIHKQVTLRLLTGFPECQARVGRRRSYAPPRRLGRQRGQAAGTVHSHSPRAALRFSVCRPECGTWCVVTAGMVRTRIVSSSSPRSQGDHRTRRDRSVSLRRAVGRCALRGIEQVGENSSDSLRHLELQKTAAQQQRGVVARRRCVPRFPAQQLTAGGSEVGLVPPSATPNPPPLPRRYRPASRPARPQSPRTQHQSCPNACLTTLTLSSGIWEQTQARDGRNHPNLILDRETPVPGEVGCRSPRRRL